MSATFDAIDKFYKDAWNVLPVFDLAMLCSNISTSLASGREIELSHFDGFMTRRKTIPISDRVDAAESLKLLADVLIQRLQSMPQSEIEKLDRVQKVINGAIDKSPS